MRISLSAFLLLVLAGCSSSGGPYPSLQPRAAEAIDPRLQPVRPVNERPAAPSLMAKLASLVDEARSGDTAFEPAVASAERLAAAAGAPQSESWIVAQQALSTATAARAPTALAQADIDALAATALQKQGGIAPNDLKAIDSAAAEVSTIARSQTNRLDAIKGRLGI
jgi:hypothetical protein